MVRWLFLIGGVLLVALSLVLPAAAQSDTARVRFVHAAPDMPPVDVFVDGKIVLRSVDFPLISDYLEAQAGSHQVVFAPAGQPVSEAIITAQPTFEAGKAHTVVAVGLADVTAVVFTDDLSTPPAGKARVRLIHASPDAPRVDVEVIDGPMLFRSISFARASDYQEVDAGTYNLRVLAEGTHTVMVQLRETQFEAGTIYDVIAVGRLADMGVQVGTYTPSGDSRTTADGAVPAPPQMMPNTGASALIHVLFALGTCLVVAGGLIRSRGGV